MDPTYFRQRLLALCEELECADRDGNADAATVELDQQRQGRLSRMDALSAQAMSLAAQQRRRDMLQRARAALARIEAGDYGFCMDCDEDIDPRRLDFDPTVRLCIACASKREA